MGCLVLVSTTRLELTGYDKWRRDDLMTKHGLSWDGMGNSIWAC